MSGALACPVELSAATETWVGAVWYGGHGHILPTPATRGAHLARGLGLIAELPYHGSPHVPRDFSGTPGQ